MQNKIAIIGAGASGLLASIILARKNIDVTVYEKNNKVGKKLLATGNGKCNITNKNIELSNFHGDNILFAKNILKEFNYLECLKFFNELGIEFVEGVKNRIYPQSLQASTVVDLLYYEAKRVGVKFELSAEIINIEKENNNFILETNNYKSPFLKLIIATGSLAMPNLGASDSGYKFAKKFGHTIIKPIPSLVQLISNNKYLNNINGVKLNSSINLFINKKNIINIDGDILFTNYGISGSAILDISRKISKAIDNNEKNIYLIIDLLPNFSLIELKNILIKRLKFTNDKKIDFWLEGLLNKKLTTLILKESNLSKNLIYAKELNIKDIDKIAYTIKNIKFDIINTKSFKNAEVIAGGIDTNEVNSITLESKLIKNLYFIGEILDIDGDCGGYNLHWAWASSFTLADKIN